MKILHVLLVQRLFQIADQHMELNEEASPKF